MNCTNAACVSKNRYNVSASTTAGKLVAGKTFSISYVDGSGVSGNVYKDVVTVAGVRSPGQYFSAVSKMQTTLDDSPVDGILGMAFQPVSNLRQPPVFQNVGVLAVRCCAHSIARAFADADCPACAAVQGACITAQLQ